MSAPAIDRMIATGHGLRLHVRDWPGRPDTLPVVCLPGLTRSLDDFSELAAHLASDAGGGRRVIAISARGRGLSDRHPDPSRYNVRVETADIASILDALSIHRAAFVGTSRGGLQAMALGAMRPGCLAAVVLNDIGPVIESSGLIRIHASMQAAAGPRTWDEAFAVSRRLLEERFTALTDADFERMARRTWRETPDGLVTLHDPNLLRSFAGLDLETPLPPLWGLFDSLVAVPLMAVRGANSDILTADGLQQMKQRRADLVVCEVPDQGHAPLLADAPTLAAISGFLAGAD